MLGFNRWHLSIVLAAILGGAAIVWLALAILIPAPPKKITFFREIPPRSGSHVHRIAPGRVGCAFMNVRPEGALIGVPPAFIAAFRKV
jgi:hypothetical protein